MTTPEKMTFDNPSETRTFPYGKVDLVDIGGSQIGRLTLQPGLALVGSCQAAGRHRVVRSATLPVPCIRHAACPDDGRDRHRGACR